jgi:serine/threonine-protein kinase
MLSGTRLFDGGTTSDALASVLTKQPDWTPIPVAVRSLLQSCLEREPSRRLRDIGDAWRLLDAPTAQAKPNRVTWIVPALVVVSAVAVAVALWALTRRTAATTSTASVRRLAIGLGADRTTATDPLSAILSPDGTQIVFVDAGADGTSRLSVRRLDQPTATVLPGTAGAYAPFFSPDGESVGFFARGKLKTLKLGDADPVILCDAPIGRGGTWNERGQIVAALDSRTYLSLVPAAGGGTPTPVSDLALGELSHRWPQFLPGGNAVVFMVNSTPAYYTDASIAVVSLVDNPQRIKKIVLPNAGMSPRYLAIGDLVYAKHGILFGVPFDPVRLEVRGKAVPVLEDLSTAVQVGSVQIDFDRQGSALYRKGLGRTIVQWLSADGTATPIWSEPGDYQFPRVSPDGTHIALSIFDGASTNVWVYDHARGDKIRLTSGNGINTQPVWTPDGQSVVFQSNGSLWWAHADGSSAARPLTKPSAQPQFPGSFRPDGKVLLTYDRLPNGGGVIRTVAIDNTGGELRASEPVPWRQDNNAIGFPAFSPDGQWIAYQAADSGVYEVYVRHYPDTGRQWQISIAGGMYPVWSRTTNELFFRTDDQALMVATYDTTSGIFKAGTPRLWSPTRLLDIPGGVHNFDRAPDGRFAVLLSEKGQKNEPPTVILALNFIDEVKRRLGQK